MTDTQGTMAVPFCLDISNILEIVIPRLRGWCGRVDRAHGRSIRSEALTPGTMDRRARFRLHFQTIVLRPEHSDCCRPDFLTGTHMNQTREIGIRESAAIACKFEPDISGRLRLRGRRR